VSNRVRCGQPFDLLEFGIYRETRAVRTFLGHGPPQLSQLTRSARENAPAFGQHDGMIRASGHVDGAPADAFRFRRSAAPVGFRTEPGGQGTQTQGGNDAV